MNTTWTYEHGRLWATCPDGRRIATWEADPLFGILVDLLNVNPVLSDLFLAGWLRLL